MVEMSLSRWPPAQTPIWMVEPSRPNGARKSSSWVNMRAMFGSRSFSISLLPPKPLPANKNLIFIPLENDTIPAWAVWNVENRSPSLQLLAQELHLS